MRSRQRIRKLEGPGDRKGVSFARSRKRRRKKRKKKLKLVNNIIFKMAQTPIHKAALNG